MKCTNESRKVVVEEMEGVEEEKKNNWKTRLAEIPLFFPSSSSLLFHFPFNYSGIDKLTRMGKVASNP